VKIEQFVAFMAAYEVDYFIDEQIGTCAMARELMFLITMKKHHCPRKY
jgi:hypothetical protein